MSNFLPLYVNQYGKIYKIFKLTYIDHKIIMKKTFFNYVYF
jgi:hypothetical protein